MVGHGDNGVGPEGLNQAPASSDGLNQSRENFWTLPETFTETLRLTTLRRKGGKTLESA